MNIIKLVDGTEKYYNPFVGLQVWYTPGRKHRPGHEHYHFQLKHEAFEYHEPQDYCDFCPTNYHLTTPEKERIVIRGAECVKTGKLSAVDVFAQAADVRRIANLYEILAFDFWRENYGYTLSPKNAERKEAYLSTQIGKEHILSLIDKKLGKFGYLKKEIDQLTEANKIKMADFMFGGTHELIIPKRHYVDQAKHIHQVCAAGDLNSLEHLCYVNLTLSAVQDIYGENPHVKFVNVYTNWLRDAGATFDHLHRQIIGMDRKSLPVKRMIEQKKKNKNIFNEYISGLIHTQKLGIAENEHTIAFADVGHPYTTVAVYVKGAPQMPFEYEPQVVESVANMIHALHCAFGRYEATNEEWYYTPPGSTTAIPWSILFKWRKNRHAGLEGSTGFYFDVFRPTDVKEMLVERLYSARADKCITPDVLIDTECSWDFHF